MTTPDDLASAIDRRAARIAQNLERGLQVFPPGERMLTLAAVGRRLLARAAELETKET